MDEREITVHSSDGAFAVKASILMIGRDVLVAVSGGEEPHIGAVAMAQPRPSLRDPDSISSTASVFTYLGHKEDAVAKACAETLAAGLQTRVVVTAGMHWEDITPDGIRQVMDNSRKLTDRILEILLPRFG